MNSKDVRVIEETGTALPKVVDPYVIDFNLSNDSVIFADIVGGTEELAIDSQAEMEATVNTTGDDQTGNGRGAGISLDVLTYYFSI